MKIRLNTVGAAACVAALSLGGLSLQAQNLLTDPSFESGGVASPWGTFGNSVFSQNFARTGTWSMENNGPGGFTVPGAFQTLAASPGESFDLTGYGYTPVTLGTGADFGIVQITFWSGPGGTGSNLGTVQTSPGNALASQQINASSPTGTWIALNTGTATAPAGTESLAAYTLVVDQTATAVYFDDLSLTVVPEPSSFALAGLGIFGLLLRRRK